MIMHTNAHTNCAPLHSDLIGHMLYAEFNANVLLTAWLLIETM
jgi:hypothetical protein